MTLLLERVDWPRVNLRTRQQLHNREIYCPPISLFRWWARRPHALIGALLEAARLSRGEIVSDPFSGGGTVALEAVSRGYKVYAQDLNPWATWGLQTALDAADPRELESGFELFWHALEKADVARAYRSACSIHGAGHLTHTFWVRHCECPRCQGRTYLYPYSMITLASRTPTETHAYYGCARCGCVNRRKIGATTRCRDCGAKFAGDRDPLFVDRIVRCAHCDFELPSEVAWSTPPCWTPVLVRRACRARDGRTLYHFDKPSHGDHPSIRVRNVPAPLKAAIPHGKETAVLQRAGFSAWRDLYPDRQLRALIETGEVITGLDVSSKVRNRLQLCLAGAAEMAGHLCRWDRFHPKAFEALANHRYSTLGLTVETNPIGENGRGTLPRRLAASLAAAKWARKEVGPQRLAGATIITGSSSSQRLADRSARLIITDPPYYDAVQYGELAGLFLVWAKVASGSKRRWEFDVRKEAVPNSVRPSSFKNYEQLLSGIFRETARTLREDGRVLLTYHSTDFRGWAALGRALWEAELNILALGVARSENEHDHAKRGRLAFSRDLVLECGLAEKPHRRSRPHIVTTPRTSDQRELLAAGIAVSQHAAEGKRAMAEAFLAAVSRLRTRRIVVPRSILGEVQNGQEGVGS